MPEPIIIPKISANVLEVTLTKWLVQEGDTVEHEQVIAELTTDKGEVELETTAAGIVTHTLVKENSTLPVEYAVAIIGECADTDLATIKERNQKILEDHRKEQLGSAQPTDADRKTPRQRERKKRVRATPAARRLAREKGVELADVQARFDAEKVTETMIHDFLS